MSDNIKTEPKTFESILEQIEGILKSDKAPCGKVWEISHLVEPEIIMDIGIPGVFLSV